MQFQKSIDNYSLFKIDKSHVNKLDSGLIYKELRKIFKNNGVKLSKDISLHIEKKGMKWLITDKIEKQIYLAKFRLDEIKVFKNINIVNQVVEAGLCVRCGACEPACPVNMIAFDNNAFPYIKDQFNCIVGCDRCLKVCPGKVMDYSQMDKDIFGASPHSDSITGLVRRALISYSNNENIRRGGASGGLVTQLLIFLMENKIIDGALVLTGIVEHNNYEIKPLVARTVEELSAAQKSKYIVTPYLKPLREIEEIEGNYAVVGIPCHIQSIRKYQKINRKLKERIKLTIGLCCNMAYEPYLINDVLEFNGLKKEDIADFSFRTGDWPGRMELIMRDGNRYNPFKFEEIKDTINSLKLFYIAPRCNMCIDFSAEYADISVSDPWLRGPDGKYIFPDGRTTVLTRSENGDKIIDRAAEANYINIKEIPLKTWMINFESHARHKRNLVPKNIKMRRFFNLPVPQYNKDIQTGSLLGYIPLLFRIVILYISGKSKFFRKIGLKLIQTNIVIDFFRYNRKRKERHFGSHYKKMENFVNEIISRAVLLNDK